MVGLGRLYQIDFRLKQALCSSEPFGGASVMLAGDIRQLPPVGDLPLYSVADDKNEESRLGCILYKLFDRFSCKLEQQMRQAGDANESFRAQLERLATGDYTESDWKAWSIRDFESLSIEEQKEFETNGLLMASYKTSVS